MKNKVLKTAIIMMLITALTISDFILVGMNFVTYALENINNSTNNENVKFAVYFKTEEKEMPQAEYEMTNDEMKLYMEVSVENEGYFDGVITLENSNFKLKQNALSEGISKIENNTITLNRVTAGNTLEIEVGIEPIIEQSYSVDMLSKKSELKLTGEYKDSTEKKISIKAKKEVQLTLFAPSNLETMLDVEVITNRIYKIGEENKRLVQIELDSNVVDNTYPVDTTTFDIALPEGVESVEVISKGTYATNGEAERTLKENEDYTWDKTNNQLQVKIENTIENGKISWKQDAEDNIIVTLILPEKAELGTEEYSAKAKVEFYGQEKKAIEKQGEYNLVEEADGLIRTSIDNDERIYKGKIYSKEEREYKSTTNIEVNYANLVGESSLEEKTTYRIEKDSENKVANVQYKTTTISKSEFDKVLGTEGILTIKDQNGNKVKEVKATDFGTEKNVTITYADGVTGLAIEITKAIATGIIRLNHTKVIKAEEYSREEIDAIKYLVEESKVKYSTAEYTFERIKELRDTATVAELTVDKQTLSTAAVNEQVKIAVTLRTDSEQYDLYKNPTFTIKLPEGITNVSDIKTVPLYLDNFTLNTSYNSNTREIKIEVHGEQTKYNVDNTNGYIEILADIELDETISSRKDEITLTYTNQKVAGYEGKTVLPINISGFSGLVAFNRITNYNITTNSVNIKEEQIGNLKMYQEETEANFQIALVNNTGTDLQNIAAVGNFPVEANVTVGKYTFNNTIPATLKSGINTENGEATIYYTANKNATTQLSNAENGWTTNLAEVTNAALYMIVISNMAKGTSFIGNYTMSIPANLEYNKDMKTTYVVDYSTSVSNTVVNATPVGLETGKVLVTLEATVGTDKLENDMTVKAGEVIRYKVTVTNTGSSEAKDVKISGLVPNGTVYIEPVEEFQHAAEIYYKETETNVVEKSIGNLSSGETKTFEYEVRVKNEVTEQTVENQVTVIYNENMEVKSDILANKLEEGNIRVTVKRVAYIEDLMPGAIGQYYVIVENITDSEQKDIQVKFNMPSEDIVTLKYIEELESEILETKSEWNIDSIPAGEYRIYNLFIELNEIEEVIVSAELNSVATQNGITYRSNVYNENLYGFDVEMKMTSPNEGEYVKTDDIIEYDIEIKNNSQIQVGMMFVDNIPEQLSIQKIEIDGNVVEENVLDNSINKTIEVKANETMTIKIFTVVNYDRARLENETITNTARVLYVGEELASTETVNHIVESIVIKEEPVEPEEPINPDDPTDPENPTDPEEPIDPENPTNPETPSKEKYDISGKVWVDQDKDGEMNNNDTILSGIKVRLLNIETNEFVRDEEKNKDLIAETKEDGYYAFEDITEGKYIVVFEYDNTLYKPTVYQKEGIAESKNSNVVSKMLKVNGEEKQYAATDEIELNQNTANINMGLVFVKQFDVEVDKYISKIIVQTSKETTTYEYQNKDFAKVEISAKRMAGSTILVQYTIKVTNTGDVDAYVNSLVDYLPTGLKFSSELNNNWYKIGTDLYTTALENTAIAPGESKEVNLTLTKTIAEGNAELINNMAEIQEAYNIYGISDTNSTQGNKNKDENDLGSADLLIGVQTGTVFNYIALVISMLGIIGAAAYIINKKIMRIRF